MDSLGFLKTRMELGEFNKIARLQNENFNIFLSAYISLCNPAKVLVYTGEKEEAERIKKISLESKEEISMGIKDHTLHFDGINDLARARDQTKFLIPSGVKFDPNLDYIDRDKGLKEVKDLMRNVMAGRTMYVLFFCLGPVNSFFSIPAVQLTDSTYVAHSEMLLYRDGYNEFLNLKEKNRFFRAVHGTGEVTSANVSKNLMDRRIYVDLIDNTTLSVNTQYGGNTLGLKKLAMRLAINLGSKEGWLCEHMFVMGVQGPGGRKTYLTGAYPSACGKTSTSMIPNEKIVGDDICYLRVSSRKVYAVNVEKGMFGIIDGVNAQDDPVLWKVLNNSHEIIFSNILMKEDKSAFWTGSGFPEPGKGINFSGEWQKGKKDEKGNPVLPSHKNARFTLSLDILPNVDENLNNPEGVEIKGFVYGGRDSDTSLPVEEAFSWEHGIITKGASLESETTAATLGKEGKREFNPMSNLDFLSIPIGKYIDNNLKFTRQVDEPPRIFSVNYFIKDKAGKFLNDKVDKAVWIKWMELRCSGGARAIKTPTGYIPDYDTLKRLFQQVLNKNYSPDDYKKQFTIRVIENINKIDRILEVYKYKVPDVPEILFEVLEEQKERLEMFKEKHGEYVSPFELESVDE
ncbi:MAG: phosphoenolpyruvate carboxykinase (GTP) [bacterium]|nr:phosphoenolpyruvate carboxykinase (GTP) [bacterium]